MPVTASVIWLIQLLRFAVDGLRREQQISRQEHRIARACCDVLESFVNPEWEGIPDPLHRLERLIQSLREG